MGTAAFAQLAGKLLTATPSDPPCTGSASLRKSKSAPRTCPERALNDDWVDGSAPENYPSPTRETVEFPIVFRLWSRDCQSSTVRIGHQGIPSVTIVAITPAMLLKMVSRSSWCIVCIVVARLFSGCNGSPRVRPRREQAGCNFARQRRSARGIGVTPTTDPP
jgi:hypothetical protein